MSWCSWWQYWLLYGLSTLFISEKYCKLCTALERQPVLFGLIETFSCLIRNWCLYYWKGCKCDPFKEYIKWHHYLKMPFFLPTQTRRSSCDLAPTSCLSQFFNRKYSRWTFQTYWVKNWESFHKTVKIMVHVHAFVDVENKLKQEHLIEPFHSVIQGWIAVRDLLAVP